MAGKALALAVWLLLLIACAVIIARTRFPTNMGAFLPRSAPLAEQVLTAQLSSGAASHLILLAVQGAPPPVLAALSQALATRLRQQAAFIDVLNGDPASLSAARDFVWRNRYVLSAQVTGARFTESGLHDALANDLGLLGSDLGTVVQQSLPSDPTGEMLNLLSQLGAASAPLSRDGVWFSADGARALLLVHGRAPGFDIDAQARDLATIQNQFNAVRMAVPGAAGARLRTSGPGVFAVHTRDTTKCEVTVLSILACAGAVGLLGFAYRAPLVVLLGVLPVLTGALAAIAAVSLTFGFVHGVTLGFGVTLIGESLDYAIYLFTQTARGETARDTLARIWPTLRLGVLTSIVGFSAMLFSNFTGFAQLGLFSIVGLIVASATTRLILPHLVPVGFSGAGAGVLARPLLGLMRHRRRLRPLALAAALFGVLVLALHHGGFWDRNIADLSPIPAADQALDQSLRHDLGIPDLRYLVVLGAPGAQQALQGSEALKPQLDRLVGQGRLAGFELPSTILPSNSTQAARRAALPDAVTLAGRLARAQAGMPFQPGLFAPFLRAAAATRDAPWLTRASLPPALALQLDSLLFHSAAGWDVIAPLHGVSDPAAIAAAIDQAGPTGATLVDLDQESAQLLRGFQHEAVMLATFGGCAILAVLLVGLGSLARAARVVAPLLAAVIVTAALLTAGGAKISIFEIVGFLLIVAVGSNYCLFFERSATDHETGRRAVAAIVLANLCTVSAYGLLSLSSIPVLHDLGRTVAIGTFLTLYFAALLTTKEAASPAGGPS